MSSLTVYHYQQPEQPEKILNHAEDIARLLGDLGIHFAQQADVSWPALEAEMADWQALLRALGGSVLEASHPLQWCTGSRQTPLAAALIEREGREQQAEQARACLLVGGRVLCALQAGERVYALRAGPGDLLVIPAGMRHWFDFGEEPHCTLLLQQVPLQTAGESADGLASRFPGLDD